MALARLVDAARAAPLPYLHRACGEAITAVTVDLSPGEGFEVRCDPSKKLLRVQHLAVKVALDAHARSSVRPVPLSQRTKRSYDATSRRRTQ